MRTLKLEDIQEDLTYSFSRSGGPGGQNVNKVNTRVTLWFNLSETRLLTETQKRKIRKIFPSRITKEGKFRVVSQKHRSQSANRVGAQERLIDLLNQALTPKPSRKQTKIPKHEREKRLRAKRRRSEIKRRRSRKPSPSD